MVFKKIKAFTLVEAICALLILSVVLLLFQVGVSQLRRVQQISFREYQDDFQVFLLQIEYEMRGFTYRQQNYFPKELYFQDELLLDSVFQLYANTGDPSFMIRKHYKGGHQPLLMNVRDWQLKPDKFGSKIEVTFRNGETYQGYVVFPE